jgi:hypothetical protein
MSRAKRGPGRPALPETERKGTIFSIRVSEEEREQIESAARAMGLKPAAWARLAMLHVSQPPPSRREPDKERE